MSPDEIIKYMTGKIEPQKEVILRGKKRKTNSINMKESSNQQTLLL